MNEKGLKERVPGLIKETFPSAGVKFEKEPRSAGDESIRPDMVIELNAGGKTRRLVIEVKALGYPAQLLQAISALKRIAERMKAYPVIITDQISERGAALVKEAGMGYLDLAGNCFLNLGDIYIEKTAREKIKRPAGELRKLFSRKATRVIRTLLEFPGKAWDAISLAKESGVSIGHAYKVAKKLREQGFIVQTEEKICLRDAGKLLDAWADQYHIDASTVQSFYTGIKDPAKLVAHITKAMKAKKHACAFTLHAGESLVAPFTRFTDVHFYLAAAISDSLLKELELERIEFGGTAHIMMPYDEGVFHHGQKIGGIPVVSNTQLYLDLFQYPARGKEAAEFLRRQKMKI